MQIIISILFLRTIKCNYMSLNSVMELSIWKGNEHLFLCSALNPVLLWNCSSNMATQTLKHKMIFLSPVSLSLWRGRPSSYRNQSINLFWKLMHSFLYDRNLHHESVKVWYPFWRMFCSLMMHRMGRLFNKI